MAEAFPAGPNDLVLALTRTAELAAIFMIGDGILGVLQPRRHVDLWRSRIAGVDILLRPFAKSDGRRQVYGLFQLAAGLAWAASLKRRP